MFRNLFIFLLLSSVAAFNPFNQKEFCGPVKCTTCKTAVESVENILTANTTQNYLNNLCYKIPKEYKDICIYAIENEYPAIIQFIQTEHTPTEICTDLSYCI